MLYDAILDALVASTAEVPASVDATFSWYFRDEDRWLTVESQTGRVQVRPGHDESAEMKFYSSCVADFIHQHTTEGAGRAIFQGGGFYWRGDIGKLKEISPLCKTLFGPRLHQRLVGAGISVPKFEVRRYPARTKAQRDRILAEWMNQGERTRSGPPTRPPVQGMTKSDLPHMAVVARATKTAKQVKAAKTVKAAKPVPSMPSQMQSNTKAPRLARKA